MDGKKEVDVKKHKRKTQDGRTTVKRHQRSIRKSIDKIKNFKFKKNDVNYREEEADIDIGNKKISYTCDNCQFYSNGGCSIVKGNIDKKAVCNLWTFGKPDIKDIDDN